MNRVMACGSAALVLALAGGGAAQASAASDAFAKCLVDSSTGKDRMQFIRWFFGALSVNPNVATMATTTQAQRDDAARGAMASIERLVMVDCRKEALAALHQDGPEAMRTSFEVFGRTAAAELMSDPAVGKDLSRLESFSDTAKWSALMQEAKK
jgi:hypothetical protein